MVPTNQSTQHTRPHHRRIFISLLPQRVLKYTHLINSISASSPSPIPPISLISLSSPLPLIPSKGHLLYPDPQSNPSMGSRNYVVRFVKQQVSRRKQRTRSSSCPLWSTVRWRQQSRRALFHFAAGKARPAGNVSVGPYFSLQLTWDWCQSDLHRDGQRRKRGAELWFLGVRGDGEGTEGRCHVNQQDHFTCWFSHVQTAIRRKK